LNSRRWHIMQMVPSSYCLLVQRCLSTPMLFDLPAVEVHIGEIPVVSADGCVSPFIPSLKDFL